VSAFASGTVGQTLTRMRGVWHDHVRVFDLSGAPLDADPSSGTPGAAPFDNLVYIDFDGRNYKQTNVTFRGRPQHMRTFTGVLEEGVLRFDRLGPSDPEHIGVSGGPGVLFFTGRRITEAWQRYAEPDCVRLLSPGMRTRTTLLYRGGEAVRTLTADGTRLARTARHRLAHDPRGIRGPVHEKRTETHVFSEPVTLSEEQRRA